MSKNRIFFFYIFMVCNLCGCAWTGTSQVGDVPPEVRVHAIKVGKHTKDDVTRLLGSPSSITLFEEESWLYIETKEKNRVFLPCKEIKREVVQVTFDANGTVKNLNELTLADGRQIKIDETVTPVSGKDLSVIDELIGNFGRFPANKSKTR